MLGPALLTAWVATLYTNGSLLVAPKIIGALEITHLFSTMSVICVGVILALFSTRIVSLKKQRKLLAAAGLFGTLATAVMPFVSLGILDSHWLIVCVIVTAATGAIIQIAWYEVFVAYKVQGAFICIMASSVVGAVMSMIISLLPQAVAIAVAVALPTATVLVLLCYKGAECTSDNTVGSAVQSTVGSSKESTNRNATVRTCGSATGSAAQSTAGGANNVLSKVSNKMFVPPQPIFQNRSFTCVPKQKSRLTLMLGTMLLRLIIVVGIVSLTFGMLKTLQLQTAVTYDESLQTILAFVFELISLIVVGVIIFFAYRKNMVLTFYFSVPILALGALFMLVEASVPFNIPFFAARTGTSIIQLLVLLHLINLACESNQKKQVPIVFSAALLSVFQFAGTFAGQIVASVFSPEPMVFALILLLLLVVAVLPLIGARLTFASATDNPSPTISTQSGADHNSANDTTNSANDTTNPANDTTNSAHELMSAPSLAPNKFAQIVSQAQLSPREAEVLKIWITGHNSAYIQNTLHISKNTVKTHLTHIYTKTGTSSREDLLTLYENLI
jgi:DNA-binding CsgD family transcriptional regulator